MVSFILIIRDFAAEAFKAEIARERSDRMHRLTKELAGGSIYVVDDSKVQHAKKGYFGEAITKLAKFENFHDHLLLKEKELAKELEKLRLEDRKNSAKFKQLLANKLTYNNILILLKTYGLE